MSIIDRFVNLKERMSGKAISLFGTSDTSSDKIGVLTEWFWAAPFGVPRSLDVTEVRSFCQSNYVRSYVDTIIKEVDQTEWRIVPKDSEDKIDYSSQVQFVTDFLNNPNRNKDTFSDLVKPMLRDVLEVDSGVWVKVFAGNELVEIFCRDGASFLKNLTYQGVEQGYFQYSWKNPLTKPIPFDTREVVYFMNNPSSYHIYGFSPAQSVLQAVEVLIQSTRFNKDFFKNNAVPSVLISLLNANNDTMKRFETKWNSDLKGKSNKIAFTNAELTIQKLINSNREMEWLEGQKWYMSLVGAAFGVSPEELGFTEDVNRASQAGQERVTVKNAIKPYFSLIERHINLEVIPDLLKVEYEKVPIIFKYFPKDHVAELEQQRKMIEEYKSGLITKNEYRQEMGYDLVEDGDEFKAEPQAFGLYGQAQEKPGQTDQVKEDMADRRKTAVLKTFVGDADGMEDAGENYEEWLNYRLGIWEKKVLDAADSEELSRKTPHYATKTFGGFIQRLFNSINTAAFFSGVKHFIKKPMKAGLEEAENELKVDIGIGGHFEAQAEMFTTQELEGYTLPDGKKWHGIKGVTKELQRSILDEVREGIINKESQTQIKDRIKNVFKTAKDVQAERIARTETNRFVNQGKLMGYIESGLKGKKEWKAHIDSKTSPLCRSLNGQKVALTEFFTDPKTGQKFIAPPSHVNCRSTIQFVMSAGEE